MWVGSVCTHEREVVQAAQASVAAGLHTAAAQQPLAVQAYSCDPTTPSMQAALLHHLGSSLSSVQFTYDSRVAAGDALPPGFKARWRSVLPQLAAAPAALASLRSLEVTEPYRDSSVAAGHLPLSALSQLTSLQLLGKSEVSAKHMQQLPSKLQELQATLGEGSSQLSLARLTALTQLHLSGPYTMAGSDSMPPKLAAATLLCGGQAAVQLAQLSRLQRLQLGEACAPTAAQLRLLHRLLGLTELHLAYKPNLEMASCSFENSPREVAKVLAGMSTLRVFRMRSLFPATPRWSSALMAGTREALATLGRLSLHTLEIRSMPLGSIAKELAVRQLTLERLVLDNCNMSNKALYAVLNCCPKLRELEVLNNCGYWHMLGDEGFGVGLDESGWLRLRPVQLPKLEWLSTQGTRVTPAGAAHLPGVKQVDMRYQVPG
ncbi:hypothetical protein COO60DRAFT_1640411 [Scenedesmus sp. NREL 46B-D3]|nr:hypothetical protein COO60DRAFT_1640411 [Scenedesmus sp. NREL 46B-D3]